MLIERQKQYLDCLADTSFQGVNRLFNLSLEDNAVRTRHTRYFLPTVEMKDYDATIDGQNFLINLQKNDLRKYGKIRENATGQGND